MNTLELVRRLYDLGLQPHAYFPQDKLGRPVVAVEIPDDDGTLGVPPGCKCKGETYFWPDHEWSKEFKSRARFFNIGKEAE